MLFESSLAPLEAPGACSAASLGRERFCGFNAAEQEGGRHLVAVALATSSACLHWRRGEARRRKR